MPQLTADFLHSAVDGAGYRDVKNGFPSRRQRPAGTGALGVVRFRSGFSIIAFGTVW